MSQLNRTLHSYQVIWKAFCDYCTTKKIEPITAEGKVVGNYLSQLANNGKSYSTITKAMAAIRHYHNVLGKPFSYEDNDYFRSILKGISRHQVRAGKVKSGRYPITVHELKCIVDCTEDTLSGIRDKAIILVLFAGMMSRSELCNLKYDDMEKVDGGLSLNVFKKRTNTKIVKFLETTGSRYCPVNALIKWVDSAIIYDGYLFRPVNKFGEAISKQLSESAIPVIVKKYASKAGLSTVLICAESLREGAIMVALSNGISPLIIAAQAGIGQLSALYEREKRIVTKKQNPLKGAL